MKQNPKAETGFQFMDNNNLPVIKTNYPLISDYSNNDNLYLFFVLDDKKYALNVLHVLEILNLPELSYPEKLPISIVGVINYNNLIINVIDIRKLLMIEPTIYNASNQLVILKTEESIFAIITDKIFDINKIDNQNTQIIPYQSETGIIKMITHFPDFTVNIIDLYSIEKTLKNTKFSTYSDNPKMFFSVDENSKSIMKKRSEDLIKKSRDNLEKKFYSEHEFITFGLNKNKYCLDIKYVKEIIKYKNVNITRIPSLPKFFTGIINLKGDFLSVIDLKKFLDIKDNASDNNDFDLIVLESQEFQLAILVDCVHYIINIADDYMANKLNNAFESKYIKAEILFNDEILNIMNMEQFFADEKLFLEQNA